MRVTNFFLTASVLAVIGCSDPPPPKVDVNVVKPPDTNITIDKSKTDKPVTDVTPKSPQ